MRAHGQNYTQTHTHIHVIMASCAARACIPDRTVPHRPRWPAGLKDTVLTRGSWRCAHCGMALEAGNTDIDHFPVPFRDIHDNACLACWPGAPRGPLDLDNLVPACRQCNRSHIAERSLWCGRSMPFLSKRTLCKAGSVFLCCGGMAASAGLALFWACKSVAD